jgi:shikimate kinase
MFLFSKASGCKTLIYNNAGLANFNPQEGQIINKDLREGCIFVRTGGGLLIETRWSLFTNTSIRFYYLMLNACSIFEQYANSILAVVYIYFISTYCQ